MQTDVTLLDVTCCVRLHTLLHVVGCCWELLCKVEIGQRPTMLGVIASICTQLKNRFFMGSIHSQMPGDYPRTFLVGNVKSKVFDLIQISISIILISDTKNWSFGFTTEISIPHKLGFSEISPPQSLLPSNVQILNSMLINLFIIVFILLVIHCVWQNNKINKIK